MRSNDVRFNWWTTGPESGKSMPEWCSGPSYNPVTVVTWVQIPPRAYALDTVEWRISEVKSVTYMAADETPVFRRSTGVRSPGRVWAGGAWPLTVKPRDPSLLKRGFEGSSGDAPPVSPCSSVQLVLDTTKCY